MGRGSPEERNRAGNAGLGLLREVVGGFIGKPFCLNCIVHIKPTTPGAKGWGRQSGKMLE